MDVFIFFLFLFFIVGLLYFYYKEGIIYLGIMAGGILIFLGVTLAVNSGSLEQNWCFSNKINETIGPYTNYTGWEYNITCYSNSLPVDRNIFNALGLMFMIVGAGIIADVHNVWTKRREGENNE